MKVLFVEDEELLLRMYGRIMQQAGVETVGVNDGSLALEAALKEKPDVILMDLTMPKMNGLDALKILKANDEVKAIPVLMLSAHEDDNTLMQSMEAGAARYLVKSNLDAEQIINILKQVAPGK